MAEYRTKAKAMQAADPNIIAIGVKIFRDDVEVAHFVARYPAATEDSIIQAELKKRILEFVRVDSDAIDKQLLKDRALAIAESLTDRKITA